MISSSLALELDKLEWLCMGVREWEREHNRRGNPVSRDCVLMRTNVNLLKRVPEYDSPTFCVLHRTKCKPMLSECECCQTMNVLHKTLREREKEREGGTERERESEREASERVCADSTVHPSYVYAKTTNAICIYILPNYIYCLIIYMSRLYIYN